MSIENLKKNGSFCSMIWNHMFFLTNNIVKPCCRFEYEKFDKILNLDNFEVNDIFYSEFYKKTREKMLKGEKIDGCKRCYEEEESGKKSLRQRYNDSSYIKIEETVDLNKPKIKWIELSFSNNCNLKCRMCDSRYSYKWYDEEKEIFGKTFIKNKRSYVNLNKILKIIDDNIVHIKFTGGEPFLIKEYERIIDYLIDNYDVSKIFLNYNTNCTIRPKDDLIKKWKKFKFVEFALSFDGIDDVWEYIRYPSKWKTVEKNIKFFYSLKDTINSKYVFRSTISILNIVNFHQMLDWWKENISENFHSEISTFNPTHLTFPSFLNLQSLPKEKKHKIKDYLLNHKNNENEIIRKYVDHFVNFMFFKDRYEQNKEMLKKYIMITDKNRNQDFFRIYNKFYEGLF
ncbi:MAG: twitch domain-containing radical SAM protein [Candidatus Dojkabacteria bacterium]|nr:twitch domain-containing radical SAM protein [Candidatus Dojkabacteria bacterium]